MMEYDLLTVSGQFDYFENEGFIRLIKDLFTQNGLIYIETKLQGETTDELMWITINFKVPYDIMELEKRLVSEPIMSFTFLIGSDDRGIETSAGINFDDTPCAIVTDEMIDVVEQSLHNGFVENGEVSYSLSAFESDLKHNLNFVMLRLKTVMQDFDNNFDDYVDTTDSEECMNQIVKDIFLF